MYRTQKIIVLHDILVNRRPLKWLPRRLQDLKGKYHYLFSCYFTVTLHLDIHNMKLHGKKTTTRISSLSIKNTLLTHKMD